MHARCVLRDAPCRRVRRCLFPVLITAVKDMASDLERKWRERFVASHAQDGQHPQPMNVDEDVVVAATTTATVGGSGATGGSNGHVQQGRSRHSFECSLFARERWACLHVVFRLIDR